VNEGNMDSSRILWLVFGVPIGLVVCAVACEWWASRGTSSEEDRTAHRLKDHHGFDPEERDYHRDTENTKEDGTADKRR